MKINEQNYKTWRWVLGTMGMIIAAALLGWGIWGVGVATSGIHGRGEQIKQVNTATNRTQAQEHFETMMGDIKAFTVQIKNVSAQADQHRAQYAGQSDNGLGLNATEQARLDSIVTGLKNQCALTVQGYDADAAKVSQQDWRTNDLPYQIDQTNPATTCK